MPIDIRSKTAYISRHIPTSLNLQTLDLVQELVSQNDTKPICFVCFSSIKAKDMAHRFSISHFHYPHEYIYYLESGIMELDELIAMQEGIKLLDDDSLQATSTSHDLITTTKNELKEKFLNTKRAWVIAFSGGKDSTCILQLFYEMLLSLPKEQQR